MIGNVVIKQWLFEFDTIGKAFPYGHWYAERELVKWDESIGIPICEYLCHDGVWRICATGHEKEERAFTAYWESKEELEAALAKEQP